LAPVVFSAERPGGEKPRRKRPSRLGRPRLASIPARGANRPTQLPSTRRRPPQASRPSPGAPFLRRRLGSEPQRQPRLLRQRPPPRRSSGARSPAESRSDRRACRRRSRGKSLVVIDVERRLFSLLKGERPTYSRPCRRSFTVLRSRRTGEGGFQFVDEAIVEAHAPIIARIERVGRPSLTYQQTCPPSSGRAASLPELEVRRPSMATWARHRARGSGEGGAEQQAADEADQNSRR